MSFLSFLGNIEHSVASAVTGKGNQKQQQPQPQQQKPQQSQGGSFLSFLSHAAAPVVNYEKDTNPIVGGASAVFDNRDKIAQGAKDVGSALVNRIATSPTIAPALQPSNKKATVYGKQVDLGQQEAISNLAGSLSGAGPEAGGAKGTASIIKLLQEAKDSGAVTKILQGIKNLKLPDGAIEQVAPKIANTADKTEINNILNQAVQTKPGVKPSVAAPEPVAAPTAEATPTTKAVTVAKPTEPLTAREQLIGTLSDKVGTNTGTNIPEPIRKTLAESAQVSDKVHNPIANKFQDPQDVLGKHFGATGSKIAESLGQAEKTAMDVREAYQPHVQEILKMVKSSAKTDVGRNEIGVRVSQALEDRANAANYLKTPKETELFNKTAELLDSVKSERQNRGLAVITDNYGPRREVHDASQVGDNLLNRARLAFSTSVDGAPRTAEVASPNVEKNVFKVLPRYIEGQAKEMGYSDTIKNLPDALKNVDPAYATNPQNVRAGTDYLQTMLRDLLSPQMTSKAEARLNKGLLTTYKNSLGLSPRFGLINRTQKIASNSRIAPGAKSIARHLTDEHMTQLNQFATSGKTTLTSEVGDVAQAKGFGKINQKLAGEEGNINDSFKKGVADWLVRKSPEYNAAIKAGMSKKDAISEALKNPDAAKEAASRGNRNVNQTQFGANAAYKPEFFRDKGFFGFIPKSFVKQYNRFSTGMVNELSTVIQPKYKRELDLLASHDPRDNSLVETKKAAVVLQQGVKQIVEAAKKGESSVSYKDAVATDKALTAAIKGLDDGIKQASPIRGPKTAKNFLKMWAAASAIQFIFSGGNTPKAIKNAAPINTPQSGKDTGTTIANYLGSLPGNAVASLPTQGYQVKGKLLNFIPGVGLVYNRSKDVSNVVKTIKTLSGSPTDTKSSKASSGSGYGSSSSSYGTSSSSYGSKKSTY